jgi:hypothetical protein
MTLLVLDLRAPVVDAIRSERDLWMASARSRRVSGCAP